jgi:hypothetical protein
MWLKDYETVKLDDGTIVDKYPGNIRMVTTCNGGKLVLQDVPNPSINLDVLDLEQASKTYLFDKFPFSWTQSVTDTSNGWGMSDFEQLETLQLEIDKTLSQYTLVKDKIARLKIINPRDSGVDDSAFDNYPGILKPTNSLVAQGIRYLDPPPLPRDLINVMDIYKDFFFLVAGTFDLEQAQTPGREVIAYKAIAALIERANTMLKGKIRNYSKMIRERGRMYLSHVMNWYVVERWFEYDEDGDKVAATITGPEVVIPAKLTVVSGSTMPVSRIQEREEAIDLYEKGAIDAEELLKKIDWHDWKNVVRRMKAGPFGVFADRLNTIGAPPQVIDFLNELFMMDEKEFESGMEKGEIPPFAAIVKETPALPEPQMSEVETAEIEIKRAEADLKRMQAEKERIEIELVKEKIRSERVNQQVALKGTEFDSDKLEIERAKAASEINTSEKLVKKSESRGTPPYRERGMKSNNQQKGKGESE